jgi:RNA polymerase sigma-70 factor (ECF subfamily)
MFVRAWLATRADRLLDTLPDTSSCREPFFNFTAGIATGGPARRFGLQTAQVLCPNSVSSWAFSEARIEADAPRQLEMLREDERRSNQQAKTSDPLWIRFTNGSGDRVSSLHVNATDEELMIRFQRGDRPAFGVIVRRHKTPLYNFALRQLGSGPVAEEVVQEAFVRVVQSATEFKHAARFSTWLYAITRNLCIDHLRKSALRRHASLDAPAAPTAPVRGSDGDGGSLGERTADTRANVERAAVSVEIGERVLEAIDGLPVEQREVFLMREVGSLPFRDIAQIVGVSENTVKSRMRYALERLQAALCEFEEYARALR